MRQQKFYMGMLHQKSRTTAKDTFHGKGFGSNLPEIIIKQNDIEKE